MVKSSANERWFLYISIFAIEWHHCGCCAPWPWPSFSRWNIFLLYISDNNCAIMTVDVPVRLASTFTVLVVDLLLFVYALRPQDENLTHFSRLGIVRKWVFKFLKLISFHENMNEYEWDYPLYAVSWLFKLNVGIWFNCRVYDIVLRVGPISVLCERFRSSRCPR